jgi:hypothetical protein
LPGRFISIQADDQKISERPSRLQIPDMADVEQIKAAVGSDDSPSFRAQLVCQRGQIGHRDDLSLHDSRI